MIEHRVTVKTTHTTVFKLRSEVAMWGCIACANVHAASESWGPFWVWSVLAMAAWVCAYRIDA